MQPTFVTNPSIVSSDPFLPFFGGSVPGLRRFELQKCFSFQAVYVRLYGQTVSNGKGKGKHENKIVCRRPCCERGHNCSSEPRSCSRSERRIARSGSYTQCPGGSCSDAARRCFIIPLDADAVIRQ